jgi:membrane protein required for colicin V production
MSISFSEIIVDLVIVVILLLFMFRGFRNGFVKEFIAFLGTYVSLIVAIRYMSDLAKLIFGATDVISSSVVSILSFVIIFLPLMLIFMFIAKKLKLAVKFSFTLGSVDRIVGLGLGLIKGSIILAISALIISLTGISAAFSNEINASQLFKPILLKRVLPLAYSVAKLIKFTQYKPFNIELKETLNANIRSPIDRRGRETIDTFE